MHACNESLDLPAGSVCRSPIPHMVSQTIEITLLVAQSMSKSYKQMIGQIIYGDGMIDEEYDASNCRRLIDAFVVMFSLQDTYL